jgi:hypothetical protein
MKDKKSIISHTISEFYCLLREEDMHAAQARSKFKRGRILLLKVSNVKSHAQECSPYSPEENGKKGPND